MDDFTDPMRRTVHELPQREKDVAVAAFQRAHDEPPSWNVPSDRAWLEGFAAGRVANGEEVADLRNVVQAACTQGGLAAMAKAWEKYFPDHPITIDAYAAGTEGHKLMPRDPTPEMMAHWRKGRVVQAYVGSQEKADAAAVARWHAFYDACGVPDLTAAQAAAAVARRDTVYGSAGVLPSSNDQPKEQK